MFSDASLISEDLDALSEITALIETRTITSVLQPVVRMTTGEVVGYEALARGPVGTRWESPVSLFRAATAIDRVAELDWVCRARAMEAASRLSRAATLFINVEPASVAQPCPADVQGIIARAGCRARVVLEMTERAVSREPGALLRAAAGLHSAGLSIGLDDVGGDPGVLAVLPLVRPEVLKLDPYVLRTPLRADTANLVEALNEYADTTGAVIAATGIETKQQRRVARSVGATLGQGQLFGPPVTLDRRQRPAAPKDPLAGLRPLAIGRARHRDGARSPFEIISARRPVSRSSASMLLPVARRLEAAGLDLLEPVSVLSYLHQPCGFPADQHEWYSALARSSAVLVLGQSDVPAESTGTRQVPGAVSLAIGPDDPMVPEWSVLVIGQRAAGALVARESGAGGDRLGGQRMEFVVTYDRDLVVLAARALLERII